MRFHRLLSIHPDYFLQLAGVLALMDVIGTNGEIDKNAYCNWPLFARVRKDESFSTKFEELFGEKLEVAEAFKKVESKAEVDPSESTADGMAKLVDDIEAAAEKGVTKR